MNITQKIYLNPNAINVDKHIKIKLEQEINNLEFLSLTLKSNDIYQSFNADYGVLVGRVIANNGIGVPNAKISIFIPLTDEDELNDDIRYIYPYKTPRDKNTEGKRYNLLPRVSKTNSLTGISSPQQPFGSFPIKEEIVSNINQLNVYKKYYKYTALTNEYGDYMIFGTPIGTQIIHMSLDVTDIGEYSMTPASMVTNLGYSPNLFKDNNTRIKESNNLNDLPNIETQEISIDIIPFWGDNTNYEIGITRQDFRVKTVINNTFTVFGNILTDGADSMWGSDYLTRIQPSELYRINDVNNISIATKRIARIDEKIYYYPPEVTDEEIEAKGDVYKRMILLDKTEYSRYIDDGLFCFIINCNRNKIIKNNNNIDQEVSYDFNGGIFTKFRGFITFEVIYDSAKMDFHSYLGANDNGRIEPRRFIVKIPQIADNDLTFNMDDNDPNTIAWKNQHFPFSGGCIYSISKFNGLTYFENIDGSGYSAINDITQRSVNNVGIINTKSVETIYTYYIEAYYSGTLADGLPHIIPDLNNSDILSNEILSGYTVNNMYNVTAMMPISYVDDILQDKFMESNYEASNGEKFFGSEWLNMSLYFTQFGELTTYTTRLSGLKSANILTINNNNTFYYVDNNQEIAGIYTNTKLFARSDYNKTNFIQVTKEDINIFATEPITGFIKTTSELTGKYISNDNINNYFYKGYGVDCIKYLKEIGIV